MPLKLKMKIYNILSDDLRAPCTEFSCLVSAHLRLFPRNVFKLPSTVLKGRMVNLGFVKKTPDLKHPVENPSRFQ